MTALVVCGAVTTAARSTVAPHPPSRVVITAGAVWDGVDSAGGPVTLIIEDGRLVTIRRGRAAASEPGHHFDFDEYTIIPAAFAMHAAATPANASGLAADSHLIEREDASAPAFLQDVRAGATAVLLGAHPQATIGGISSVYRPLDYWSNCREVVRDVGLTVALHARSIAPTRTAIRASWEVRKALLLARERANDTPHAMDMLLAGSLRMQVETPTLAEFARAVAIAQEFGVHLLATDVHQVPAAPLPYDSLSVLLAPPRLDELPELWDTYTALRRRSIPVGILIGDTPLPTVLALSHSYAAQHALSDADLLAAFTSAPARVLGAATLGRLVPGRSADFLVVSGRLFDARARIEHVFIEGREVFDRQRPRS
jgi:hypothetical protein